MNPKSLEANEAIEPKKATDKERILRVLTDNMFANQRFISQVTKIPRQTVAGRINDLLYIDKLIVSCHKSGKFTNYRLRKENEPAEERPLSKSEKIKKQIEQMKSIEPDMFVRAAYDRVLGLF